MTSMKRKLQFEISDNNKMLKFNQTENDTNELDTGRKFNFELTDKKAKANLLKSANRIHLEIENKQKCSNLRFSAGAFLMVARPFIKECESKFLNKVPIIINDMEITIEEYRDGMEMNNKHFDTKIALFVNRKKVVIHSYNSTQNLKVDGSIYVDFLENFLIPLFRSKIDKLGDKISQYDRSVYTTLSARGRPIRPRSVKSVRSVIHQSNFTCKCCGYEFVNYNQLKKHKLTEHGNSFNSTGNSLLSIRHSTRNNSIVEDLLLCEDMSIAAVDSSFDEEFLSLKMSPPKFHCSKCGKTFKTEVGLQTHGLENKNDFKCESCTPEFSNNDIKNHTSQKHSSPENTSSIMAFKQTDRVSNEVGVEIVRSCDKCDFESEDEKDMDAHKMENVHDVWMKNITLDDEKVENCKENPVIYECHLDLCKFIASHQKALDEHGIKEHGILKCIKCEYTAEDQDILKNHMKTHTGRIIFTCTVCEFEATREILLENHKEMKHGEQSDRKTKCCDCEKMFPALFLSRYHICGPQYTYPCQLCSFVAIDLEEIVSHLVEYHTNDLSILKCDSCDFKSIKRNSMEIHLQTNHKNLKVDIGEKDQVQFQCDQCEYKCTLNIKLKNHKKKHHETKEDAGRSFKCNNCEFKSNYVLHMWEHRQTSHPENVPKLQPKAGDMVPALLAEQGYNILEEVITMKTGLINSFTELAAFVHTSMEEVKTKVEEKHSVLEASIEKLNKKISIKTENEQIKSVEKPKDNKIHSDKADNHYVFRRFPRKKNKNSKANIAWVGTSISNVLDKQKFEHDTNTNVEFVNVVPEALENDEVDVLVMETGSTEITNIKVNEALLDTSKQITEYKDQWFKHVEEDSKNLFKVAEDAIKQKPNLKVIVLKRLPRFDRSSQDILGIKSQLSNYANQIYDQLWIKSGCPNNIHILELKLNTEDSKHLRDIIFGTNNTKHFDGIHLRGTGAVRHVTYRAVQTIKAILPKPEKPRSVAAKTGPRLAHRPVGQPGQSHSSQSSHIDCPQARYQRQQHSQYSHTDCPQARYQRQQQTRTQASYAEVVRGGDYGYSYAVPTSNRLTFLD